MSYSLKFFIRLLSLSILLCAIGNAVSAQSGDINSPTPVRKSDLLGRISARDLGDSRLTNHYYAFTGTPGDLIITIQSRNLNGDIDVFTAGSLRPLLKLSLYAESNTPVTKGIYLRRRENLILRIEARSPNDDEGTYQILFSGSFEPVVGGPDIAEGETPTSETPATARKGKRVTSVGARIDEPAPPVTEVAVAPTPEPTPEATPVESPKPKSGTRRTTATSPSSARTRRPAGRRANTPAPKPTPRPAAEETAKQTEETKPTEETTTPTTEPTAAPTPKPRTPRRSNTARSGTTARPVTVKPAPTTPAEPEPEIGPRLIIETNDGTLINRSMSTVRRVTVERGWVVVTGNDGKVDRMLLVNVTKMTIQPQ